MLVAARLRHIASTKWGKRRHMVMDPAAQPCKAGGRGMKDILPGLRPVRPRDGFAAAREDSMGKDLR
jgi:hypothetical protein